jgi:hypothetical protein
LVCLLFCAANFASFSGLSILDCPFGFLGPSAVLSVIIAGVAALLSGKYVLQAGPSAVISVIIAGVAALLSGKY